MTLTRRGLMRLSLVILVAFAVALVFSRGAAVQVTPEQRLAAQLLSEDKEARDAALEAVRGLSREKIDANLRSALIALLEKETQIAAEARSRGVALSLLEDPEFVASVERTVGELRDPAAIPALARAMGTTFVTVRPLAQFGEQAAAYVLDVIESPESYYNAVAEGLLVLRFMIEKQAERPLTPGTVERIRRAARMRLIGEQYFTVLWRAADLAAVLNDSELWAIMNDLATNPQEAILRGITDPSLVEKTQRRARDLLAGEAPLPRPDF